MQSYDNIGVIFGGPGPEHDVSILTGLQAERSLSGNGVATTAIYWDRRGDFYDVGSGREAKDFRDGTPAGADRLLVTLGSDGGFRRAGKFGRSAPAPIRVLVVCCHGAPGECGRLQGLLDLMGLRYTGPTQAAAALGMDKLAFAALAQAVGVGAVPRFDLADPAAEEVPTPLILKPRYGGSSIGVELVDGLTSARELANTSPLYAAGAVVEPFLDGWFDVNIAVRTWPTLQLSAIEKPIKGAGPLLTYGDKYVPDEGMAGAPRELPADVSKEVASTILAAAEAIARATAVRGVARVDFMTDGTQVLVNEINTIPGSLARYLWVDPELAFFALLTDLIDEAVAKPAYQPVLQGADGRLLRTAASVAAKLA